MPFSKLYLLEIIDSETVTTKTPAQLVNETASPFFIGFIISAALFGVTCAQGCLYFKRHSQDNTRLKSIVIVLLFLETFHAALVTHSMFSYTITGHGSLDHLNGIIWSLSIQVVPATLIVALVQYVWIIRVGTICQSHRVARFTLAMLALVVIDVIISIAWMVATVAASPRWGSVKGILRTTVASFSLRVFNDTFITGLLCYHLQRSKNGIRGSDRIIQTLIGYGLRAGLLNCMCSMALLILVVIMPTRPYYVGIYIVSCRLYANSLLAMLNWRIPQKATVRAWSSTSNPGGIELSSAHWSMSMSRSFPVTPSTISEPGKIH